MAKKRDRIKEEMEKVNRKNSNITETPDERMARCEICGLKLGHEVENGVRIELRHISRMSVQRLSVHGRRLCSRCEAAAFMAAESMFLGYSEEDLERDMDRVNERYWPEKKG